MLLDVQCEMKQQQKGNDEEKKNKSTKSNIGSNQKEKETKR